jgi:hypothetical protein
MTTGAAEQRAIARALAHGGAAAVRRLGYGRYEVESATRPGRVHHVAHDAEGRHWRCSCEAGLAGRGCWHQGAVYVAKKAVGVRVTGPAAPAAPEPANVVPLRRAA